MSDRGVRGVMGPSSAEESEVTHSFTHSDKILNSSSDGEGLRGGEAGHTYFCNMLPPCVSSVSLHSGTSAGKKHELLFSSDKAKTKTRSSCPTLSAGGHGTFPSHTSHCRNTLLSFTAVTCVVCIINTVSDAVMQQRYCYHPGVNYFPITSVFYSSDTTIDKLQTVYFYNG